MKRGTIVCPVCGNSPARDYLKEEGQAGRLGERMMAVVYTKEAQSGKHYRIATDLDGKQFSAAENQLNAFLQKHPDAFPDEPLPLHIRNVRGFIYGFKTWGELFNSRQVLALMTFTKQVKRTYTEILKETNNAEYAKAVISELSCVIDRMADKASSFVRWKSNAENTVNTFGRQAIPMVWDYAEVNPVSGVTGDWINEVDWVVRVIEHSALAASTAASLQRGDATRLTYANNFFDAVITDPPYYDSISYAELSDFFYVWQKRSLGHLYPGILNTPLTPKSAEIIQETARHANKEAAKQFYEEQMTLAFTEAHRVLTTEGICVVVFAHKSTAAWETLLNSLLQAGLVVTSSWPVHTEMGSRVRAQGNASLASSIFIVCRKRIAQEDGFFDDVQQELRERIAERLSFFWGQGIRGADFFISAIGPAVQVFGRYSRVRKLTGEDVSVAELLDLVQEMVADYALRQVFNGRYQMGAVDAPTRFYVMYRWSYSKQKLPFDDARRLAQALGAEVDELFRYGILKKRGATVTVPESSGRAGDDNLGEPARDGSPAPVIDVLHRALRIWQQGDRQVLRDFLVTHAIGREDAVNVVAQAIASVLPSQDEERRMLENYLQGSDNLPAPSQPGLFAED